MSGMLDFFTEGTVTGELVTELQGVVENIDPEPSATKELKLYTAEGIPGTTVAMDVVGSTLQVVQTSARGTDAPKGNGTDRDLVDFRSVRVALEKDFTADDALNIRRVGTGGTFEEFSSFVGRELAPTTGSVRGTVELHRLGGLRGYVLDKNGTVITDLYAKFGITPNAEIGFELDAVPGAIENPIFRKLSAMTKQMRFNMKGKRFSGVGAICGSGYFDGLVGSKEFRATYLNQPASSYLRTNSVFGGRWTEYAGVTFYECDDYIGDVQLVEDDEVRFFPMGSPGAFRQFFAPHDRLANVYPGKAMGLVEYVLPSVDTKGRTYSIEVQSNPITVCTVPGALFGGRAGDVTP